MDGRIVRFPDSLGELVVVTDPGGVPAPATNYSPYTLPSGYIYKMLAFDLKLVTSASPGNRYFRLCYNWEGGGINRTRLCPQVAITASKSSQWSAAIGLAVGGTAGGTMGANDVNSPLPDLYLPEGAQIEEMTKTMLAGDQVSGWEALFMRWRIV